MSGNATDQDLTTYLSQTDQGLRRLIDGNKRFAAGKAFPTVCKETLAVLAKGQQLRYHPWFAPTHGVHLN